MFLQIRKYELKSGTLDPVVKKAADDFNPILRRIPGFVDYLIVDCGHGKVLSVSIFKDKKGVEEADRKSLEWNRKNAEAQLPGPPEVFGGEVLFEGRESQDLMKAAS